MSSREEHLEIEKKNILVIGADLVMPKLFYFSNELQNLGYSYKIYSHDDTEYSRSVVKKVGAKLLSGPPHRPTVYRMLRDIFTAMRLIRSKEYHHAELYSDYNFIASLCYLFIMRLKGIRVIIWCRGELYHWNDITKLGKIYFHIAMRLGYLIILKERYMISTLEKSGIYYPEKSIELHNSVPTRKIGKIDILSKPTVRLLYLNSFKSWRNVGFCVDLAAELRNIGIDFSMTIVGEKNSSHQLISEAKSLRKSIEEKNLDDFVSIKDFSENPSDFYLSHDLFILPANLIYCNYSLLEAMQFGLIPLVSDKDQDYRMIIEEGISGFGLPLDASIWAEVVKHLASDRAAAKRVSTAAKQRIDDKFSTDKMFHQYAMASGIIELKKKEK